ncbi:MAG: hypothetical protein KY476_22080 [Planctomycetes bacterium]|nr:hypothetical protein [Planctomycetota bacterium]
MSHSHMPVHHLLRQLEDYRARRQDRDRRPDWLVEFIAAAAELFEPLDEVARVGFDCRLTECGWRVALYLGETEEIGGSRDGARRSTAFHFDILRLIELFSVIETLRWGSLPAVGESASSLEIEGRLAVDRPLKLLIAGLPPGEAGAALHRRPDGRLEPA